MTTSGVTLAQAGVPLPSRRTNGMPAFTGMTKMLLVLVALLFAVPAGAQTFPANNGSPVVDQAGILRPHILTEQRADDNAQGGGHHYGTDSGGLNLRSRCRSHFRNAGSIFYCGERHNLLNPRLNRP